MAILRAHMGQQEARDEEHREILARQEQRFNVLQHQFQMLQLEVQVQTSPVPDLPLMDSDLNLAPSRPHSGAQRELEVVVDAGMTTTALGHARHMPRMETLTEDDDIEHFLITLERIAIAY